MILAFGHVCQNKAREGCVTFGVDPVSLINYASRETFAQPLSVSSGNGAEGRGPVPYYSNAGYLSEGCSALLAILDSAKACHTKLVIPHMRTRTCLRIWQRRGGRKGEGGKEGSGSGVLSQTDGAESRRRLGPRLICICRIPARARAAAVEEKSATPERK